MHAPTIWISDHVMSCQCHFVMSKNVSCNTYAMIMPKSWTISQEHPGAAASRTSSGTWWWLSCTGMGVAFRLTFRMSSTMRSTGITTPKSVEVTFFNHSSPCFSFSWSWFVEASVNSNLVMKSANFAFWASLNWWYTGPGKLLLTTSIWSGKSTSFGLLQASSERYLTRQFGSHWQVANCRLPPRSCFQRQKMPPAVLQIRKKVDWGVWL